MTRVKSGRGGAVLLWLIGLMLLGSLQPGMSQEEVRRPALVLIRINLENGSCSLEVGPRGVGVCHSPTGDCDNFVTWRWIGMDHGYDEVRITQKPTSPAKNCFDMPVTIKRLGGSEARTLRTVNGNPPEDCDAREEPQLWTYMVEAVNSETGRSCKIDPGVVIER